MFLTSVHALALALELASDVHLAVCGPPHRVLVRTHLHLPVALPAEPLPLDSRAS